MAILLFLELYLCFYLTQLAFSIDICLLGLITSQAMINSNDWGSACVVILSLQQHFTILFFIYSFS